jgi:hypothetical protein
MICDKFQKTTLAQKLQIRSCSVRNALTSIHHKNYNNKSCSVSVPIIHTSPRRRPANKVVGELDGGEDYQSLRVTRAYPKNSPAGTCRNGIVFESAVFV